MTNYEFNVDHSNPQDHKKNFEFGKETKFDIKQKRRPSIRDNFLIKLLNSPTIMASRISRKILSSDPNGLCDRLKSLQQEKQAGNNCKINKDQLFAKVDKLLEYKAISNEQQEQILIKSYVLHTKKSKNIYSYS